MRYAMRSKATWFSAVGLLGLFGLMSTAQTGREVVGGQKRKPVSITRFYTGPDGETHAEEMEAKFLRGDRSDAFKLMGISGAEVRRSPAGSVMDWHTAPRRQYFITLSGRAEVELAGGKKITLEPGHIELVEDTTGKGHITRVVGTEDRVMLVLPLSDQFGR